MTYKFVYKSFNKKSHNTKLSVGVKVKLKAKEEKCEKIGENEYLVFVKEAPVEGKANEAIIKILAKYFKVSKSQIKIISGLKSRQKIIEIS